MNVDDEKKVQWQEKENGESHEQSSLIELKDNGDTNLSSSERESEVIQIEKHDYFTSQEIERYSRQLFLSSFGIEAQNRLLKSSILVIGAGGLGCAALTYLAGAGVKRLGIMDHDTVQINNLHRQVIYREKDAGLSKAYCASDVCKRLNGNIEIDVFEHALSPQNSLDIVSRYDVVLDATDNAATRYLISDACVISGKPLVSGSAIGTDGQMTVYNYNSQGPCYRCIFPVCPSVESCSKCSDAGVLGPAPGAIGVLQAMEAIKIISKVGAVLDRKLLICDFLTTSFRSVTLRNKSENCICISMRNSETKFEFLNKYDYFKFTGQIPIWEFGRSLRKEIDNRLDFESLENQIRQLSKTNGNYIILDVRPKIQYDLSHISGSLNIPFENFDLSKLKISNKMDSSIFVVVEGAMTLSLQFKN